MTKLEIECFEIFGEMRDATKEELNGVSNYIDSISIKTENNFYDFLEKENKIMNEGMVK